MTITTAETPTVSVLMPAYNYADYVGRAITSALEQDYPEHLLSLVVVDDGSTDGTAAVVEDLARRHDGRVRLIRQPNSGPSAAINRALAEASGELLAILDADDIWLPQKTRRQVDVLGSDSRLGMVFCDMTVVDGDERVVRPSQVGQIGEFPRRAFARLLYQNVATQSSIMLRRELARPIPDEIPYSDWWFALTAAEVSEVRYLPERLALYREHGSNLTSGVSGAAGVREHRKEIAFQLWALRNLDLAGLSADELQLAWSGVEEHARRALATAGSHFVELMTVTDGDRDLAQALRAEADDEASDGDRLRECLLRLRALARDPFAVGARSRFGEAVARANAEAELPDPLLGARRVVVLTTAEDLLGGDEMLDAYAAAMAGMEYVTLAIDAAGIAAAGIETAGAQLSALVARCGLSDRHDIHMLGLIDPLERPQRRLLVDRCIARFARTPAEEQGPRDPPTFTPAQLGELRALIDGGRDSVRRIDD